MNYYEHHIGDFRSGTVNMTRLERWIYRDLIEVYYDTEEPLSADVDKLCKDIGARNDEEKAVVREILAYKFTLTECGYVHARCEETIANYRSKADTARENGKKGGRPRKADSNPEKPSGFSSVSESNQDETGSKTNQKPVTNNQEPKEKKPPRVAALSSSDLVADGVSEETANEFLALRRKKDAPLTPGAWKGVKAEAAKAGWSNEDAVAKCLARGWTGFEAEWVQPSASRGGEKFDPVAYVNRNRPDRFAGAK